MAWRKKMRSLTKQMNLKLEEAAGGVCADGGDFL
jgi:hypothetical protein